jgi:hypothetical protein
VGIITESDIFEALLGVTGANTRGKMVPECGNVKTLYCSLFDSASATSCPF